jgi:DNA-binding NarL/FixJ family response regulator
MPLGLLHQFASAVFGDEYHVIEALRAGATGYLLKDADVADITLDIRTLHAGGSPINPVIARRLLQQFASVPNAASREGTSVVPEIDVQPLSDRERTVLSLVAKGFSYDEITGLLKVSRHTVLTYVKRTYGKLRVHSKTEAVYEARKLGLVDD